VADVKVSVPGRYLDGCRSGGNYPYLYSGHIVYASSADPWKVSHNIQGTEVPAFEIPIRVVCSIRSVQR
jgi:hypothetical protein